MRDEPLSNPSLEGHDDLYSLVSESWKATNPTQTANAMTNLPKFTHQEALRTLTSSAMILWIFQTDFPNFAGESGGANDLLRRYRECLLQTGM